MGREREKKSWRDIDRGRDASMHRRVSEADRRREETSRNNAVQREYRNALEALFSPKRDEPEAAAASSKLAARIVLPPSPNADPRNAERRRLLGKLLGATGPGPISKVADEFVAAGFTFPDDQEIHLQLLEHVNELRVREAIDSLQRLFAGQLPKRKPLLEQRLRRIEEQAEEAETREAAAALRRVIQGRGASAPVR